MPHQDRLNIAVFIDFDNIEIGVKTTLGQQFDVGTILDAIKERGEVVTKIAYADWTRAGEYSRSLTQHAIRLVQRNLTPGGDKNGADINLALDALEMAFTHPHINAYVIVGGDSDFLSLVEKLKQYDKKVFVVGGRAFTSVILQRNCHEFIAYENLAGVRRSAVKGERPVPASASLPIAQAFPIVRRALKILADREVSPQTGLLKSTLLQLDSTFSERTYGASSFLDFVEKLSQAGMVQLKHAGRSVMVELNEGFPSDGEGAVVTARVAGDGEGEEQVPAHYEPPTQAQPVISGDNAGPRPTEPAADGLKRAEEILIAAANARWPMYLRNVKQILRAAPGGFDERRYGFAGLVEFVRACQKQGFLRLERDRRGGLRVFPGPSLHRAPVTHESHVGERPRDVSDEQPSGNVAQVVDSVESDFVENEPMPTVDPTAELLGTTKRRRTARPGPTAPRPRRVATVRKAAAPKSTARRSTRSKKVAAADGKDEGGRSAKASEPEGSEDA